MPITVHCSGCGASFTLADSLIGKRVRCKTCASVIPVGEPAAELPVARMPERARRRRPLAEDEYEERRFRGRRAQKSQAGMIALVAGGVVAAAVLLAIGVFGIFWWVSRSHLTSTTSNVDATQISQTAHGGPAWPGNPAPQVGDANARVPNGPPARRGPGQGVPQRPPNAGDANGSSVQLSNARISGFGARIQIEVDFRLSSGLAGSDLYLMIKPTRSLGLMQNVYECRLHQIAGKSQGTIEASGMTFGLENGPFEVWMEEGDAGPVPFMVGPPGRERRKVSNVLRVETKEFALPGPMPGPFPPGMPRPGIPHGPWR